MVACRTLIGCVRDHQSGFVGGGEQYMGKSVNGLIGRKVAFFDGAFKHGADGPKSIEAFQFAPPDPAKHGWPVNEQYPLNVRGERGIEKAN